MISPRRQSREIALKAIYQAEINTCDKNESLKQVVIDTLYSPATETAVKEFLKSTKAQEILSGAVEEFIPDFVDNISETPYAESPDLLHMVKSNLEKHFPGVTVPESFQTELTKLISLLGKHFEKPNAIESFSKEIVSKISDNNSSIEKVISSTTQNWSLDRMAAIDRCILKIAVCEFFYFPTIPVKATINEAIELAKKYSTDRSYEFVNGILDKISKENKFIKESYKAPTSVKNC